MLDVGFSMSGMHNKNKAFVDVLRRLYFLY
jgi:hypothetical protein